MKKILIALVASTLILGACSKESKVNKKLDGTWNLTKENNVAVVAGSTITFMKDGKEGSGSTAFKTATESFTYTLDNNVLTITKGSTMQQYTVATYTDTDLKLEGTNITQEFTK